jgi:hypothetical protein
MQQFLRIRAAIAAPIRICQGRTKSVELAISSKTLIKPKPLSMTVHILLVLEKNWNTAWQYISSLCYLTACNSVRKLA